VKELAILPAKNRLQERVETLTDKSIYLEDVIFDLGAKKPFLELSKSSALIFYDNYCA